MNIHFDFETRSELDIWKVGAWNYSIHSSTEILCMAWCYDNGTVNLGVLETLPKNTFSVHIKNGANFICHYSMFENYIWHNILVKRYGWPVIPLRQWRCTAALAAAHALPRSLQNAAIALDLKQQKDMSGKRIMLKLCKPRKISKNNKEKWFEDPEDLQKLYDYCINDVEVERAIDNSLPQLSAKEQEIWFLDQLINTRGIQIDQELVYSALYLIEQYTEECNAKLQLLTGGYIDKCSQVARIKNWMASIGVHTETLDKEGVRILIKASVEPKILNVLKLRQEVGKTSVKKFQAIKNAMCSDRRLRDTLIYHGASTGRWTGKIVQPHNLPRGSVKDTELCINIIKKKNLDAFKFLYPNVMDALSSCVRGAFVAAPGKDLLVVDFASIEARVLAWIAGEKELLEEFRTGEDSYVKMAEIIYGTDKITKDMRFVGKQSVLGCGYGMGAKRFMETCKSLGYEVLESLAKQAVTAFRKKNIMITALWRGIEKHAIYAVNSKGFKSQYNNIKFFKESNFLYCVLPSGRKLAYHHPKIERMEKFGQIQNVLTFMGVAMGSTYTRQETWGGTLVENIVQGIARDFLAEAMLRVEKHGYKVVLHVHDEIVAEVPEFLEGDDFNDLDYFINDIITLPNWAEGCPIAAEGWRGKRYRK